MYFHSIKLGNLSLAGNVFLAPVAGYSDSSFRSICVSMGASFTYTELISSEAIVRGNPKTEILYRRAENEKNYAVQLFGNDENKMAEASRIVFEKTNCSCIDINAGCPVPKVVKTGAGSALMKSPEKVYKIIRACKNAVDERIPITIKIRSGWNENEITFLEISEAAISAGVAAITLHPRTRAQGYSGKSNWQFLKELVKNAKGRTKIFGSGDLFCANDAKKMFAETNCDGLMFARGAMGNPFIFSETISLLKNETYTAPNADEKLKVALRELDLLSRNIGEAQACREMRKKMCAYTKGIAGGARLRDAVIHAETKSDYEKMVNAFVNL